MSECVWGGWEACPGYIVWTGGCFVCKKRVVVTSHALSHALSLSIRRPSLPPCLLHPSLLATTKKETYLGKGLAAALVLALVPAGELAALGAGTGDVHG